jgi:hypothetical protein
VVGHGTLPVGTTGDWTAMSGNGLTPPVASSVEPIGIPTRPTVERDASPGDEAEPVGLDAAVVPLAQVPEAVPADRPAPSNNGVGAAGSPAVGLAVPLVPGTDVVGCVADAPRPEQVDAAVMAPSGAVPAADGLTPGVASSVAPSGIPVAPTGAPGPKPSGEVTPIGAGAPVIMPVWAKADPQPSREQATAAIRKGFMAFSRSMLGDYAARRSGGAMNSGPTGSLIVFCRIRSISAIAELSTCHPTTSAIGAS